MNTGVTKKIIIEIYIIPKNTKKNQTCDESYPKKSK